jgi:hypothetical protein
MSAKRKPRNFAEFGTQMNTYLQVIMTNAGNIAESDTSVKNHSAARIIEAFTEKCALLIREFHGGRAVRETEGKP